MSAFFNRKLNISLSFQNITLIDDGGQTMIHPYCWNLFFKIDETLLSIDERFQLNIQPDLTFPDGSKNNVSDIGFNKSDKKNISKNIGFQSFRLSPIHIPIFEQKAPGIVCGVFVLLRSNNISPKGMEAAHTVFKTEVQKILVETIQSFDPKKIDIHQPVVSAENFFKTQLQLKAKHLPIVLAKTIQKNQNILQNLWSLVKRDDLIGFHPFIFSHKDFEEKAIVPFKQTITSEKNGTWLIEGVAKAL